MKMAWVNAGKQLSGLLICCMVLTTMMITPVLARVPAAVVIEVGDFSNQDDLNRCEGVQLNGEVLISKHLGDQVRGIVPVQDIQIPVSDCFTMAGWHYGKSRKQQYKVGEIKLNK